jgi:peroxiredoxin Q/BCP
MTYPRGVCLLPKTLAVWLAIAMVPMASSALGVGERAPDFRLQGSDGAEYTLEGVLATRQGLVLAWFPKAFTPG